MKESSRQDKKEEFELLVEHITDMNKGFLDKSVKVAGFLLLALGWFATSNDAREYLQSTPNIANLAATAVAVSYAFAVGVSVIGFVFSRKTAGRLNELAYLPESAYRNRILSVPTFLFCVLGNGVLAILLIFALLGL